MKYYIVVGTGTGSIGHAVAKKLHHTLPAGVVLVTLDQSIAPPLQEDGSLVSDIHLRCDLLSEYSIEEALSSMSARLDRIQEGAELAGFVFAAGANHISALEFFRTEDFNRVMDLNVKAPWLFVKYLDQLDLLGNTTGVFLGSNTAFVARTNSSAYAASKGALASMVRSLHRELAPRGVSLMTLDPGPVFGTEMDAATRVRLREQRGWDDTQYEEMILKNVPGNVPIYAEDVARQAVHLAMNGKLFGGSNLRMDHGQQSG